jgi:dienelactone hydrolase
MGWAHGGMAVLYSVIKTNLPLPLKNEEAFKAAISFYPYCDEFLTNTNAPFMILHGQLDDWTPAESCSQFMVSKPKKHDVILKIYPEAYHCFDWEGRDEILRGLGFYTTQKLQRMLLFRSKVFWQNT